MKTTPIIIRFSIFILPNGFNDTIVLFLFPNFSLTLLDLSPAHRRVVPISNAQQIPSHVNGCPVTSSPPPPPHPLQIVGTWNQFFGPLGLPDRGRGLRVCLYPLNLSLDSLVLPFGFLFKET